MSNELYLVFFYEILGAAFSTQEFSFKKVGIGKSEKKLDRAHTLKFSTSLSLVTLKI